MFNLYFNTSSHVLERAGSVCFCVVVMVGEGGGVLQRVGRQVEPHYRANRSNSSAQPES